MGTSVHAVCCRSASNSGSYISVHSSSCAHHTARKCNARTGRQGSVLASDAFFPFSWGDSVEKACAAGVAAIAHPGGSLRDGDAVACCNQYGVVLVTTGVRHFRH
jgi:AICAR transformylase/IMP cyclohydrolase PurH